jgi:hypothetical protein
MVQQCGLQMLLKVIVSSTLHVEMHVVWFLLLTKNILVLVGLCVCRSYPDHSPPRRRGRQSTSP